MVPKKTLDGSKVASNESDLNPIEHMWRHLRTANERRHFSNLRELEQFEKEEWPNLPVERCRNVIEVYRKRLGSIHLALFHPKAVLPNIKSSHKKINDNTFVNTISVYIMI